MDFSPIHDLLLMLLRKIAKFLTNSKSASASLSILRQNDIVKNKQVKRGFYEKLGFLSPHKVILHDLGMKICSQNEEK